jgi:hypothetical protein
MTQRKEPRVSAVAVIVAVLVALSLVAMLIAGVRKSAAVRAEAKAGTVDRDVHSFRSHAEASRSQEDREHEAV